MTSDIIARRDGKAGRISLNRPAALHALTLDMVHAMIRALMDWRDDPAIECVLIDHAVPTDGDPKLSRGFCAGGDIAFLRKSALNDGGVSGRMFFHDEYQLNHLIFTYPKPVVAFMDGVTMGGGVGISQPARYRVATENTRLAMPETGIGLFPDVGGGWYLSRLAGHVGEYLALTGHRLSGPECLALGLASHFVAAATLAEVKAVICAQGADAIGSALVRPAPQPDVPILAHIPDINRHFGADGLEAIMASLAADPGAWAQSTLATLATKSPQTCKVALRQLRDSRLLIDFADNMVMEYRIASRVLTRPDFAEGVRAVIVDKDNAPRWDPPDAQGVTDQLIDSIFAPLPADGEWKPIC